MQDVPLLYHPLFFSDVSKTRCFSIDCTSSLLSYSVCTIAQCKMFHYCCVHPLFPYVYIGEGGVTYTMYYAKLLQHLWSTMLIPLSCTTIYYVHVLIAIYCRTLYEQGGCYSYCWILYEQEG